MKYSFNLLERPWIPCLLPGGQVHELSLCEALNQANMMRGIAGDSPLETAAIYRLLLAVLHSALRGPENAAAWNQLWQAGTWNQPWLHAYLEKWQHRFDLFHEERPFYQAKDERVKQKSISSLAMDMASGNNATLFDHHTEDTSVVVQAGKAARILLVAQLFGLAGLSGLEQKFTDGPWGRGIIFLVEGDTLFQTLALNCLRYTERYPVDVQCIGHDLPAWEADDPYQPREIPLGYLDYLTWHNRRVYLVAEGPADTPVVSTITVAPGLRLKSDQLDPFKNYRRDETKGYLSTRFSEDRALWRDSSALFNVQIFDGRHPPTNFSWVTSLVDNGYVETRRVLSFMALGMANDQAKVEFFRQEHLPLPLAILKNPELSGQLESALLFANEIRAKLWNAVSWMAVLVISPISDEKKWQDINRVTKDQAAQLYGHWAVDSNYWSALEIPFFQLLVALPEEPEKAITEWKGTLKRVAWGALENAVDQAGKTVQVLKAAVRARGRLRYHLAEVFPEPEKEEVIV